MFSIANIKLHVKITNLPENINFSEIQQGLIRSHLYVKVFHNFIVVKGRYTYTIFNSGHINITKVNNINKLKYIKKELDKLFSFLNFKIILSDFVTDNITACYDFKHNINLNNLYKEIKIDNPTIFEQVFYTSEYELPFCEYTPELFSALLIKTIKGTMLIFSSGKINIVGCRELWTISWLLTRLIRIVTK